MKKRQRYRVLVGINYPPGDKRAEPGKVIDDLPPGSVRWLLKEKAIEPVEGPVEQGEVTDGVQSR